MLGAVTPTVLSVPPLPWAHSFHITDIDAVVAPIEENGSRTAQGPSDLSSVDFLQSAAPLLSFAFGLVGAQTGDNL